MKKIVYALILAVILPLFTANAAKFNVPMMMKSKEFKNVTITKDDLLTPKLTMLKSSNSLQADEYYTKLIAGTPMGFWIGYAQESTPMAFDPESGITIYSTYTTGTLANNDLYCTINLFWTSDNGENWAKDTLGAFTNEILVCPSIGITNSGNATNPQELNIVNFSRYAAQSGQSFPWAGGYFQWRNEGSYETWASAGPEQGVNASFYMWNTGDMATYKKNGETMATAVQVLRQNNALAKYGIYGQASLNINSFDNSFSLPNEWAGSNFWEHESFNMTYNSKIFTDADNSGNVYAAVFNFCNKNDNDSTRTPAVSKSTNGGSEWSDINICPAKVIENYMTANNFYYRWPDHPDINPTMVGGLVYWPTTGFSKNAFVVTGDDEYSYITAMYCVFERNDSLLAKNRLVEIFYKSGSWGINTIADLSGAPYSAYTVEDDAGNRMYDTIAPSADDYEIWAAKTADGNDIVCTFVQNSGMYKFNPPLELQLFGTIDSLPTTDVYGGVRSLKNNTWESVQFTNDDYYNKLTRLPKVVKNRNNVNLVAHQSVYRQDETVWTQYPAQFQNMNFSSFQRFYMMNLDFANPKKYFKGGDVKDAKTSFTLDAPYPNPANISTEISFNMNEASYTNISVYNAMGVKVAELQNGYTTQGIHGLTVNTESYVPGVYYVVLSAGSQTATTILNVVR